MIKIATDDAGTNALRRLAQLDDFKWLMTRLAEEAAKNLRLGHQTEGMERYRLDGDVRTLIDIHAEATGGDEAMQWVLSNATEQRARIPVKPARVH